MGVLIGLILIFIGVIYGIYRFAKNPPPAQSTSKGPAGVAGWLLLLVVGLIFIGPFSGAGRIDTSLMMAESQHPSLKKLDAWLSYKSAVWWLFLPMACLSIYAGFGLAKGRNPAVVKRAKIVLWVVGPAASIVLNLFLPVIIFGKIESFDPDFFGSFIGSAVGAAIWTTYLSKSRRVKATYFSMESEST